MPRRIHAASDAFATGDLSNAEGEDVRDDVGEYGLKSGGDVIIVPGEIMPERTGTTSICHF